VPWASEQARLVEQNLDYVRAIAGKVRASLGGAVDLEELVAYGTRGLVEAADRFDAARGASFATFSYYRIRGAIYDGLREMGWLNRSEYARHRGAVLADGRANEYLGNLADRAAGAGDAPRPAATLEQQVADLADVLDGLASIFVTSLDALGEQGDRLADPVPGADERLSSAQDCTRVRAALVRLPDKERSLIEMHYYGERTLEQAGAALGLSKSWASRLHARAVDLLRKELCASE
jgi:RNA polymerase sigma factor for flagellar operon FliA